MNLKNILSEAHLNGQRTAENFIDECVNRKVSEDDILFMIVSKFTGSDLKSRQTLQGFLSVIHEQLKLAYRPLCEGVNDGN